VFISLSYKKVSNFHDYLHSPIKRFLKGEEKRDKNKEKKEKKRLLFLFFFPLLSVSFSSNQRGEN